MCRDIISRAEEFFYFDDDLCDKIEEWARDRCDSFDQQIEEHPIYHQELFEEFCTLFESIMERFLTLNGLTTMEFYQSIRNEMAQRNPNETFSSVLLSSIDFAVFCQMMADVKAGRGVVFCPPLVSMETMGIDEFSADSKTDSAVESFYEKESFAKEEKSSSKSHK